MASTSKGTCDQSQIPSTTMDPSDEAPSGKKSDGQIPAPAPVTSDEGKAPVMEKKKKKKKAKTKMKEEEMPDYDNMPSIIEILGDDLANCPQDYIDELKAIDDSREEDKAFWIKMQNEIRGEREGILRQYFTKGYAEYEVDIDDDDDDKDNKVPARVAAPLAGEGSIAPPSRRRFRNGVAVKKNLSGGGSVRKI
uniref:Uncharacterized protein n=1 Tax=Oryza meridionalis TaxID=40149 RepID=A0A0E0F7Y0_9ORYZ